ncbi:MAG: LysR substrate-binding domain-containing protein [Actinomycetota bacterium]|nr:LysR substrate-binding domain-containing protein [Actinomycetota bacterium]
MELRQLRYFVAVAEELHFRRAAARLHVSQPPVSQQIAALENELGFRLLNRTRRRVELTAAGRSFLTDARSILAELEGAVSAARRLQQGEAGVLRVGFVGSALLSTVPATVQRFRAARPGVQLVLRERSTVESLRALNDGVIDVALVRPPIELAAGLRSQLVLRERMIAAVPVTHPLTGLRRLPLRRLAAQPLVLFPREQAPGFHDLIIDRLAATGTTPIIVQAAPEMLTIIGLVAAGIGLSLVPASVGHLALDGVTYRPITGAPHAELLAITRSHDDSPLVAAFVAEAQSAPAPPAVTPGASPLSAVAPAG